VGRSAYRPARWNVGDCHLNHYWHGHATYRNSKRNGYRGSTDCNAHANGYHISAYGNTHGNGHHVSAYGNAYPDRYDRWPHGNSYSNGYHSSSFEPVSKRKI